MIIAKAMPTTPTMIIEPEMVPLVQIGGNSGADCNRLGYLGYLVDPDLTPIRRDI